MAFAAFKVAMGSLAMSARTVKSWSPILNLGFANPEKPDIGNNDVAHRIPDFSIKFLRFIWSKLRIVTILF